MNRMTSASFAALCLVLAGCSQAEAQQGGDQTLTQLADRIAIEDLIVRYYDHLGEGDPSAFGDYYTEDAVFDVNGVVLTGREEIEGIYRGPDEEGGPAEEAAPAEQGEQGVAHMLLSNPVIEINGDTATASFIWTQIRNPDIKGPPVFVEQGREYDLLTKRDGRWLIQKRTVIADSGMPDMFDATYEPRLDYDITAD